MAPESSLCPFAVNSQSLREKKKIILSPKVSFASYIRVQILKENLIGSGQPIDCNPVCPSPITHDGGGTRQKEAGPCGQVDRPS